MAIVALLSVAAEPSSAEIAVAGVATTERQVRQVRHAGATRVYVLGGHRSYGLGAVNLDTAAMLGPRLHDGDTVLLLAAGVVADDRIIEAVVAAAVHLTGAAPVVATWPAGAGRRGVERIDALTFAAGVAAYPAALVRRVVAQLGDWDLSSTLLRAALCDPICVRVDLARLAADELRRVPLTCALVTSEDTASAATAMLLAATARPRADALGRYVHPAVQRAALRWLAPAPVAPQAIAVTVTAIGLAAAVAFGFGWLWTGLALALLFGPLQGTAERLAQARALRWQCKRGNLRTEVIGYSWWLALAAALTLARGNGGPFAVAALVLLAQITATSEARVLRRMTRHDAEAVSAIDGRVALLAANKESLALLLVPFALAGFWYAGLITLAGYAVASFATTHARFLRRLQP